MTASTLGDQIQRLLYCRGDVLCKPCADADSIAMTIVPDAPIRKKYCVTSVKNGTSLRIMYAASQSTPLVRNASGQHVSARSKSGNPACSAAASAWRTGRATPDTFKQLAQCRAMSASKHAAHLHRLAGNEAHAQHIEKVAGGEHVTKKDRATQAKELQAKRAGRAGAAMASGKGGGDQKVSEAPAGAQPVSVPATQGPAAAPRDRSPAAAKARIDARLEATRKAASKGDPAALKQAHRNAARDVLAGNIAKAKEEGRPGFFGKLKAKREASAPSPAPAAPKPAASAHADEPLAFEDMPAPLAKAAGRLAKTPRDTRAASTTGDAIGTPDPAIRLKAMAEAQRAREQPESPAPVRANSGFPASLVGRNPGAPGLPKPAAKPQSTPPTSPAPTLPPGLAQKAAARSGRLERLGAATPESKTATMMGRLRKAAELRKQHQSEVMDPNSGRNQRADEASFARGKTRTQEKRKATIQGKKDQAAAAEQWVVESGKQKERERAAKEQFPDSYSTPATAAAAPRDLSPNRDLRPIAPAPSDTHARVKAGLAKLFGSEPVDDRGMMIGQLAKRAGISEDEAAAWTHAAAKKGIVEYDHSSPERAAVDRQYGTVHTDPATGKPIASFRIMKPKRLDEMAGEGGQAASPAAAPAASSTPAPPAQLPKPGTPKLRNELAQAVRDHRNRQQVRGTGRNKKAQGVIARSLADNNRVSDIHTDEQKKALAGMAKAKAGTRASQLAAMNTASSKAPSPPAAPSSAAASRLKAIVAARREDRGLTPENRRDEAKRLKEDRPARAEYIAHAKAKGIGNYSASALAERKARHQGEGAKEPETSMHMQSHTPFRARPGSYATAAEAKAAHPVGSRVVEQYKGSEPTEYRVTGHHEVAWRGHDPFHTATLQHVSGHKPPGKIGDLSSVHFRAENGFGKVSYHSANPPAAAPRPAKIPYDIAPHVFASRVANAVKSVGPEGRFGGDKVYINHAHAAYEKLHGAIPLDQFKSKLVEANRERHLDLSRADLVEAMDPEKVRQSEIAFGRDKNGYGGGGFHFVRDDKLPDPRATMTRHALPPRPTRGSHLA